MAYIIKTKMEDDFECKCGNASHLDGFYPCNENGKEIEPEGNWNGLYVCARCKQIFNPI